MSCCRVVLLASCPVGAPSYSHKMFPVTTQIGRRVEMATYLTPWLMLTLICPAIRCTVTDEWFYRATATVFPNDLWHFSALLTTHSYILRRLVGCFRFRCLTKPDEVPRVGLSCIALHLLIFCLIRKSEYP